MKLVASSSALAYSTITRFWFLTAFRALSKAFWIAFEILSLVSGDGVLLEAVNWSSGLEGAFGLKDNGRSN